MSKSTSIRTLAEARALRLSEGLVNAATLAVVQAARPHRSHEMRDGAAALVLKAATEPAALSSDEWAGVLSGSTVSDFIGGLTASSAAAAIFARSVQITPGRSAGVRVPGIVASATAAKFVAEGQPIPATAFGIGAPLLEPRKIGGIVIVTRETARSSAISQVVRQVLTESIALGLDAALLGDAAASATSPAGLRNGATNIPAAAGGGETAMVDDLVALAEAVSGVGGADPLFVTSPTEFVKLRARLRPMPFEIVPSAALPTGTLMALAPSAIATAVDELPEFETTTEGIVHEDDAPAHIGTESGVAAPSRSLFQTDCIGLRVLLSAAWALRAPASDAVATIESTTW